MRKTIKIIIVILISILIFSACQKNVGLENISSIVLKDNLNMEFTQTTRYRNDYFAKNIKVYSIITDYAEYEIEIDNNFDENKLQEMINNIDEDIYKIQKYFEDIEYIKPSIFIVSDISLKEEKYMGEFFDNNIITNIEDVFTGEYINLLVSVVAKIDDPWIYNGIGLYIREYDNNDIEIAEYFNDEENLVKLNLFAGDFFKSVAGDEIQFSQKIAASLIYYIEQNYGKNEIVNIISDNSEINLTNVKNEWLQSINVNKVYSSIYEGLFDDYIFESSIGEFDIDIIAPFAVYKIKMQSDSKYFFISSNRLKEFLYKNQMGVFELKDILSKTSNVNLLKLDEPYSYYINEEENLPYAYSDPVNRIAYLYSRLPGYTHIHETVHIFSPTITIYEKASYDMLTSFMEGYACYLTTAISNEYSCQFYLHEKEMYTDIQYDSLKETLLRNCDGTTFSFNKNSLSDSINFEIDLTQFYLNNGGKVDELENFDRKLYMDACSYAIINFEDKDELSNNIYEQYESFVAFLVENYSLDHIILSIQDISKVEEIFNKSYANLIEEWKDSLIEKKP